MFWYVILSIWKTSRIFLAEIYHCIGFSIGVGDVVVGVSVGVGIGVGVGVGVGVAFASCKALISYKFFYEYLLFEM
jgi:hypothetical protein